MLQNKRIDAFAAHPGTAKTAIWDKMDKNKVEGVAFDLTAKVGGTLVWRCHQILLDALLSMLKVVPAASLQSISQSPGVVCVVSMSEAILTDTSKDDYSPMPVHSPAPS